MISHSTFIETDNRNINMKIKNQVVHKIILIVNTKSKNVNVHARDFVFEVPGVFLQITE